MIDQPKTIIETPNKIAITTKLIITILITTIFMLYLNIIHYESILLEDANKNLEIKAKEKKPFFDITDTIWVISIILFLKRLVIDLIFGL